MCNAVAGLPPDNGCVAVARDAVPSREHLAASPPGLSRDSCPELRCAGDGHPRITRVLASLGKKSFASTVAPTVVPSGGVLRLKQIYG